MKVLGIPGTRNWAIVGRKQVGSLEVANRNVEELIEGSSRPVTLKEKKAGDH